MMTPSEFSTPLTRSGLVLGPMIARAAGGAYMRISGGAKHIVFLRGSRVKDGRGPFYLLSNPSTFPKGG